MKKIKVGLIGLGEVAQVIHLPVLKQLQDRFEVTALCDVSPELVRSIGSDYPRAAQYTQFDKLAGDPHVDAVFVLTSNEYHTEGALAAIHAGKHVLIEKPMSVTIREADEIIAAKNRMGVTVMVGYMRRFAAAFEQAVDKVRGMKEITYARVRDLIGPNAYFISQSSVVQRFELPEWAVADRRERGRKLVREAIGEASGELVSVYQLLLGLSSHDISAMREMLGLPKRVVSAEYWRGGRYYSVLFDYGDFRALFETGVDEQGRFDGMIEVMSPTQTVKVDYETPYIRHLPAVVTVSETDGDSYRTEVLRPTYQDPYTRELLHFHRAVTERLEPKTSAEDAREDLVLFRQIIDAMRQSGNE